jgi:Ran GTPase-activating protein (RanGAP) involved in mRNA processing and transport
MVLGFIEGCAGLQRFDTAIANARNDESVIELALICIPFCDQSMEQVVALLQIQQRNWKSILISNCSGKVDVILEAISRVHVTHLEIRSLDHFDRVIIGCALGKCLTSNEHLKKLTLSIVTLSNDAIEAITNEVAENASVIESVRLSCCTIQEDAIPSIAGWLRQLQCLQSLKVDSCGLEDDRMAELVQALFFHPRLEELLFPYNQCSSKTISTISDLLLSDHCQLRNLDCGQQHSSESNDDDFLDIGPLVSSLNNPTETTLRVLNLSYSKIRCNDMVVLANSLNNNASSSLEHLYLCGTKLSRESIRALASALPHNQSLTRLWLTGNESFDHTVANELCLGLRNNSTLQDILLPQWLSEDYTSEMEYYMDLNRGGRRLFRDWTVPVAVWPHVLERANRMKLQAEDASTNVPVRRVNILYHLLRERVLLLDSCPP